MSRDLNHLGPEFRAKAGDLLQACQDSGYTMRPFFTLRTPFEQAKLWRQSRSSHEIDQAAKELRSGGAAFLAHCLQSVGPQNGRWVTNALPGFSWHQWGEALDCYWLLDGIAEWSTRKKVNAKNGYANYAELAQAAGLTAGGFWTSLKDWPHVQLRSQASPRGVYSLAEINSEMERRFGS